LGGKENALTTVRRRFSKFQDEADSAKLVQLRQRRKKAKPKYERGRNRKQNNKKVSHTQSIQL
jgi:hypothetical protein